MVKQQVASKKIRQNMPARLIYGYFSFLLTQSVRVRLPKAITDFILQFSITSLASLGTLLLLPMLTLQLFRQQQAASPTVSDRLRLMLSLKWQANPSNLILSSSLLLRRPSSILLHSLVSPFTSCSDFLAEMRAPEWLPSCELTAQNCRQQCARGSLPQRCPSGGTESLRELRLKMRASMQLEHWSNSHRFWQQLASLWRIHCTRHRSAKCPLTAADYSKCSAASRQTKACYHRSAPISPTARLFISSTRSLSLSIVEQAVLRSASSLESSSGGRTRPCLNADNASCWPISSFIIEQTGQQ